MSSELANLSDKDQVQWSILEGEINFLRKQLEEIQQKTRHFEVSIRNALSDEILEIKELTLIYKQLKQAKKEKRLIQKQKGKHYKNHEKLVQKSDKSPDLSHKTDDQKELRRIYKEAMWLVHPDKFAMQDDLEEQATVLTQQLIEIYHSGNLEHIKAFYAQLTQTGKPTSKTLLPKSNSIDMLRIEKSKLEKAIEEAVSEHLYKVLLEYENPMDYMYELKVYFDDKLIKLRKRTRKA